jgi:hypothetical protein
MFMLNRIKEMQSNKKRRFRVIKFRCPHCDQKLGVPDEYANRRIRCNKCSKPSRVPAAANPTSMGADTQAQATTTTASQTQAKMNAEEFLAQDKQDSVNIQLQTSPRPLTPPEEISDFDELETVEEAPNRQAVRQVRDLQQQRKQARISAQKSKKRDRPNQKAKSGNGGRFYLPALLDFVPDILRFPLGLVASAVGVGVVIAIWVFASRATSNALGFIALFVPLAGATGLRLFAVNRTLLLALLGTMIGGLGIAAGKAAIAKYVVIPYCHEQVNKEVLVDLKSLLADERYQLEQGTSAKFVAQDGDFMQCVALISLVDDGLAEPKAARKWALHILLASNKTNIYAHLMSTLGSGPDAPPRPKMEGEDEAMFALAYTRLSEWFEGELELRKARQYFPALNCISGQANLYRLLEKPDTAFKFAILDTLGIFDALWILLGMGLAYLTLAMD